MHISDLHYLGNEGRPMKQQGKKPQTPPSKIKPWSQLDFSKIPVVPKDLQIPLVTKQSKDFLSQIY